MATVYAARAAASLQIPSRPGLNFNYGVYECAENLAATTVIEFCRVPPGAIIVDGFIRGDDLEGGEAESEELNFDIGYAANGAVAADPDAFGDLGVTTGDAVAGVRPEAGINYRFQGVLKDGPLTLTRETALTATINVDAETGGTGTLFLGVYYLMP
jgi:hypothetical protein